MRILLLGHSLIAFGDWGHLLPGHAVVSLGRAGETTAGLLGRLDDAVRTHPRVDAVAVMIGTNDILAGDDSFLHEFRSVARRLTDRFSGPGGLPRGELYDPDGVHLSAAGYRVWAQALAEALGA